MAADLQGVTVGGDEKRGCAPEPAPSCQIAAGLLLAVGAGSRPAFAQLYQLTAGRLNGAIQRILRNRSDAQDALQETYVKVWRLAAGFDRMRGDAISWLVCIARNTALDVFRRAAARPLGKPRASEDQDPYEGLPAAVDDPVESISRRRAMQQLHTSLDEMPARQRQCMVLALFDGLSHSEIAAHLGHPLGTVKSTIRRALERLRPRISEYQGSVAPG